MKKLLIFSILLFCLVPFAVIADAQINLDTGTVHAPWDQGNADNEYKANGKGFSIQHPDGTYTAQFTETYDYVNPSLIDYPDVGASYYTQTLTDCTVTVGTFTDDDGNEYRTNDCTVIIKYAGSQLQGYYTLTVQVQLNRAVAAATAAQLQGAPSPATVSTAFR